MDNMIYYKDFNLDKFKYDAELFFDTESSLAHKKFNKPKCPNCEKVVHVYSWAISNNLDDTVIYGENLKQFFEFFDLLLKNQIEKKTKNGVLTNKAYKDISKDFKFNIGVHNLTWDASFVLYYLNKVNYKQHLSDIININTEQKENPNFYKKNRKVRQGTKTYSFVENDGSFYSLTVVSEPISVQYKEKKEVVEGQLSFTLKMWDTYKVQPSALGSIAKSCITVDEMFRKGEHYDYDKIRKVGHKLTEDELSYLYNDVYILKEWYNQVYLEYKTMRKTISAISFESYLKKAYGEELKDSERMELFHQFFPKLNQTVKNLIRDSYRGGWTQANRRFVHRVLELTKGCLSIDINSSYPAVIKNKPLPLGTPVHYSKLNDTEVEKVKRFVTKSVKEIEENQINTKKMKLISIRFDAFRNKDKENLIGEIQIEGINVLDFKSEFKEYKINSSLEYFHTNIVSAKDKKGKLYDFKIIGSNVTERESGYRLVLWEHELANILENTEFLTRRELGEFGNETDETYLEVGYDVEEFLEFDCQVGHFGKAVDYYVKMKQEGKKTGNKVTEMIAKLILNSFYGKLASNNLREERVLSFINSLMEFKKENRLYTDDEEYYPAYSSCVTAWGRVNLRQQLYTIGHDKVLYFDTDSLYTLIGEDELRSKLGTYARRDKNKEIVEIIDENGMLDPLELGKWDIEKEYTRIKTIGAKKYMVFGNSHGYNYKKKCKKVKINKSKIKPPHRCLEKLMRVKTRHIITKCAGLPEEARSMLNFNNFKIGQECEGKKQKVKVKGGYILATYVYKIADNIFV